MRPALLRHAAGAAAPLAADAARGGLLHEQKCVRCHSERYGGDGGEMYLRPDRLVHNLEALRRRVAVCNRTTGAGLLPGDENAVATYLNQRYYKFDH